MTGPDRTAPGAGAAGAGAAPLGATEYERVADNFADSAAFWFAKEQEYRRMADAAAAEAKRKARLSGQMQMRANARRREAAPAAASTAPEAARPGDKATCGQRHYIKSSGSGFWVEEGAK